MGILEDIDLVAFARETAERAAAGGETVRRTEMVRCAWLMLELADMVDQKQEITGAWSAIEVPRFEDALEKVWLMDGPFQGQMAAIPQGAKRVWLARTPGDSNVLSDAAEPGVTGYFEGPDRPRHEGMRVFEAMF